MSYILEALRRSQAERERGRVPGLDAQPMPADPAGRPRRAWPLVWVISGLGLLLLLVSVLLATWWMRPQIRSPQPAAAGGATPPAMQAAAPAAQPAPATAAAAAIAPAPALAAPPPPVPVLPQVVSVPPPPPPPPAPSLLRPAAPPRAAVPPSPSPGPSPGPSAAPAAQVPAPVPAAPPAPPPLIPLAQLSVEQRRSLPPLAIGGSIWSDNAANRFVIVNGQVVREGEAAAAGVTLERIAPKSLLLRWRDLRIEVPL